MEKKYHIERNTVQETLIIPLYAKKLCSEAYPNFFRDDSAVALVDRLDYDGSLMKDSFMRRFGVVEVGMRMLDLAWEIRDYLREHPKAIVVNLGCGLDDLLPRVDNGQLRLYNLDFPDVIAIRNELMPPREREVNLAADLNDYRWMENIPFDPAEGIVFAAAGVFYYFQVNEAISLFRAMAKAFPGGRLTFDTCDKKGLKIMLKTYLEGSDMKVSAFFAVKDPAEMGKQVPEAKVSAKKYMTGYTRLDKTMPAAFRALAVIGDRCFGLRIMRLDF